MYLKVIKPSKLIVFRAFLRIVLVENIQQLKRFLKFVFMRKIFYFCIIPFENLIRCFPYPTLLIRAARFILKQYMYLNGANISNYHKMYQNCQKFSNVHKVCILNGHKRYENSKAFKKLPKFGVLVLNLPSGNPASDPSK
jgi:hypothetical protein